MGFAVVLLSSACAARRVALPADAGTPLPEFREIHASITAACSTVRTLTAELALAGRAGGRGVRGRAIVGFARPDAMRLEGVAPFGPPAFILAARGGTATLLLPRDSRVLTATRPEEILGALAGVALTPADLQAILTGCVTPVQEAAAGRLHGNRWASVQAAGGSTLYLERVGAAWQLRAARRPGWEIGYGDWRGTFPGRVRLHATSETLDVDLSVSVSQLETNVDLDPVAFQVTVPADALDVTIEELRRAGPLRQ